MIPIQFIQWLLLLRVSHSLLGTLLASLYMGACVFHYSMSALLHRGRWDAPTENWLLKLDHAGIVLMIACNFTPIGVLCLPRTGLCMLSSMWSMTLIGLYRIFLLHITHPIEPIATGALALISLREMHLVMTPIAFWSTMTSYIASITGGIIFIRQRPDPYPKVFGFHEIMHPRLPSRLHCESLRHPSLLLINTYPRFKRKC